MIYKKKTNKTGKNINKLNEIKFEYFVSNSMSNFLINFCKGYSYFFIIFYLFNHIFNSQSESVRL